MSVDDKDNNALPLEPPDDSFRIRCPRLGHQIHFAYCRSENNGLPCFKTLDCWYTYFNVQAYFEEKLTKEEFEACFIEKGTPKIFSLVDLINRAKERRKKAD